MAIPKTACPRPAEASRLGQRPLRARGRTLHPRVVGIICDGPGGRELVKRVQGSHHLLRAADAWGVDLRVAESARKAGVQTVRVTDTESGVTYTTPLPFLLAHGFRRGFGYGLQVFLPRSEWAASAPGQLGLFP